MSCYVAFGKAVGNLTRRACGVPPELAVRARRARGAARLPHRTRMAGRTRHARRQPLDCCVATCRARHAAAAPCDIAAGAARHARPPARVVIGVTHKATAILASDPRRVSDGVAGLSHARLPRRSGRGVPTPRSRGRSRQAADVLHTTALVSPLPGGGKAAVNLPSEGGIASHGYANVSEAI